MKDGKELVVIAAKVSPELAEKLKYLAQKADMTQSRLVSNILDTVVPDLVLCDKIGVFQLSYILRDMGKSLKGWVKYMQDEGMKIRDNGGEVALR